jgi:hypothetical protein
MDDFEAFTREKIERLRAEADALEKILKEFQATKARLAGAARRSGGDNPRSGAFGAILEAISAAGPKGLTLDEMELAAEDAGFSVKRTTLRAQVWKAKDEGQLVQIEVGRYRSATAQDQGHQSENPPATTVGKTSFNSGDDYGFSAPRAKDAGNAYGHTEYRQDARGNWVPINQNVDLDDEIPF